MGIWKQLLRKKNLQNIINEDSQLGKVLSTLDLTALGVGCTLGVGIYVLPGAVAKDLAGPGVIYSFLYAAITSVFAGLCFAEFGARVPKAGSAYTYSYVTVGEFIAFIIGWSLIMEYSIGTASVAKGLSVYLDSMIGGQIEAFHRNYFPMGQSPFFSEYFDFFAFAISIATTIGLAVGLKESVSLNNLLTLVNVSVVFFVIIAGSFKANLNNWEIPEEEVPQWAGSGGFLPYGITGTITGAATCFFGYVGFDCISASGEEVKNPQKAIPVSIILSLTIVFFAYFGVSAVVTLMWPYYLQNPDAPLPYVFSKVGWPWAQWIVAVGGVFGLLASMIGGMFPLPRIIYAMANDGLLFKFLGKVNSKFKTPLVGTLVSGIVTGIMAAAFKLKQLVDLMSIGTLLAYAIVSGSVLLLRYQQKEQCTGPVANEYAEQTHLVTGKVQINSRSILSQMFNRKSLKTPTNITAAVVIIQTVLFSILSICLAVVSVHWQSNLILVETVPITVAFILIALMIISLLSLSCQPSQTENLKFKVPLVPIIPGLSIFCNFYLMVLMNGETWIRFSVWLAVGLAIYIVYGFHHSSERSKCNKHVEYTLLKTDEED